MRTLGLNKSFRCMTIYPPYRAFYQLSIEFCLLLAACPIEAVTNLIKDTGESQSPELIKEVIFR